MGDTLVWTPNCGQDECLTDWTGTKLCHFPFLYDNMTLWYFLVSFCLDYSRGTPCGYIQMKVEERKKASKSVENKVLWGFCWRFVPFWCFLFLGLLGASNHLAPVAIPPGRTGFYRSIFKGGCRDGHFATTLKGKDKCLVLARHRTTFTTRHLQKTNYSWGRQ